MTIDQTETIDFIGIKETRVNLLITDHLQWDENDEEHLFMLQEKVNAYLRFVESGEMNNKYPNSKERDVEFEIAFKYLPNNKCQWFLDKLNYILDDAGIKLIINTSKAS